MTVSDMKLMIRALRELQNRPGNPFVLPVNPFVVELDAIIEKAERQIDALAGKAA